MSALPRAHTLKITQTPADADPLQSPPSSPPSATARSENVLGDSIPPQWSIGNQQWEISSIPFQNSENQKSKIKNPPSLHAFSTALADADTQLDHILTTADLTKEETQAFLASNKYQSHRQLRTALLKEQLQLTAQDHAQFAINRLITLSNSNHAAIARLAVTQLLAYAGLTPPPPIQPILPRVQGLPEVTQASFPPSIPDPIIALSTSARGENPSIHDNQSRPTAIADAPSPTPPAQWAIGNRQWEIPFPSSQSPTSPLRYLTIFAKSLSNFWSRTMKPLLPATLLTTALAAFTFAAAANPQNAPANPLADALTPPSSPTHSGSTPSALKTSTKPGAPRQK